MSTSPGPRCAVLAALVALCLTAGPSSAQEARDGARERAPARGRILSIARQETKDGPRWTVLCDEAPVGELLVALTRKAGLTLEGSELVPTAVLSVDLDARPLEQILDIVVGSQGLRHEVVRNTLRLLPATADSSELLRLAQDAWKTVEAESDPSIVAQAKLAEGNLAEVRGDLDSAYHIYSDLSEDEHAAVAPEATYRAGRILVRLGHWAEAAQHFRALASEDGAEAFHAKARLELARVSIELGDAKSALHLLNFLDTNYPNADAAERGERCLVRALARNARHEYVDALRTLEEGEFAAAPEAESRALAIRAEAFEGLGYEVEAARAWLLFARETTPAEERTAAFERAARLSLAGGDELGTLFVCREAAKSGADEGLGSYAHQARLRLGLDEEDPPATIDERLALAESLVARGETRKAAELFEGLYLARGALAEPEQARVLSGWAHVVLDRSGIEAAIDVLARARADFQDPMAAQALDLAAAELFESEGRYEDAAEAYRGRY